MKKQREEIIEAGRIIAQGLTALEVFEKTGNRLPFRAVLDQAETFKNKKTGNIINEYKN